MSDRDVLFEIDDLHVSTVVASDQEPIEILKGISLKVREGEVHALVGPEGSGKSTLAASLMGAPDCVVSSGRILLKGDDITYWDTEVRAKAGLFLAFQFPQEIAGVTMLSFLRQSLSVRTGVDMSVHELRLGLVEWMRRLDMEDSDTTRYLNEGLSAGEKKRNEILQMAILKPDMAILVETDSGLDDEALRVVATGLQEVRKERPKLGTLAITHHQHLLDQLQPDYVHVLTGGRIVASGGPELSLQLETNGYESFR